MATPDAADVRLVAAGEILDRLGAGTIGGEVEVVRDGLSLLAHRGEVLVRVRPRALEPMAAREVEIARILDEAAVPAATLVGGRGQPWLAQGCVVTAWRWEQLQGIATPEDLGRLARQLREHTVDTYAYDAPRFDPFAGIRNAVAVHPIGDEQADFVRARVHELSAEWARIADADPYGTAIVHGDLHTDNVLLAPQGPLLSDLELAGAGPCSYDAAPAVVAVERYGAPAETLDRFLAELGHDPRSWHGFRTCLEVYELWVTAWAVGVRDRSAELAGEAATRVRCLRDHACEDWHLL